MTKKSSSCIALFFCMGLLAVMLFNSCNEDYIKLHNIIQLNKQETSIKLGDTLTLAVINNRYQDNFDWKFKDQEYLTIDQIQNDSLRVIAEQLGQSTVYLYSPISNTIIDSCIVHIVKSNIVRILAIGNSFSEDALETHLAPIFDAADRDYIIGNMFIGGADLDLHLQNILLDNSTYSYRKLSSASEKEILPNMSIKKVLQDEDWDYISFQQASPKSGIPESFTLPLPKLYELVKAENKYHSTQYILHQTWAYSKKHVESNFIEIFKRNQIDMYNAICNSYQYATEITDIKLVVPVGTAIQNARTTELGDDLTIDGYHLDPGIGRYIAACTWYQLLTKASIFKNKYTPSNLTQTQIEIAKKASYQAIRNNFKITMIY